MREIVDQTEFMEDDDKEITKYIMYNELLEVIKLTYKTMCESGIYPPHEVIREVLRTLPAVDMNKIKIV